LRILIRKKQETPDIGGKRRPMVGGEGACNKKKEEGFEQIGTQKKLEEKGV